MSQLARPFVWHAACKERLSVNPDFIDSWYADAEREKEGIKEMECPSNSPDFNTVEMVWFIMKLRMQTAEGQGKNQRQHR